MTCNCHPDAEVCLGPTTRGEMLAVCAIAVVFASAVVGLAAAGIHSCLAEEAADPCATYIVGDVQERDDHGRPAVVRRRWCETWKPGRGPEGGAP